MNQQAASERLLSWVAACTGGIVAAALLSGCAQEPEPSDLYVNIDDGAVTVRAHDAPLNAVIEKLAEHGGLLVLTQHRLDQRVTVDLHSVTLRAALQDLLREHSFVLADAPQDGRARLWILAKGVNPSSEGIPGSLSEDSHESVEREQPRSLDELSAALTDNDAGVRKTAIGALEDIGGDNALETLAMALRDRDASVRATAVDAIGEIGGDAARPLLESALADESAVVREAATERLVQR